MALALLALVVGLVLLIWSADKFVDGAAGTAKYYNVSPLIIGMVIVGFGTSAPEMLVSALSALNGKPALALGNAYGSNIANIALILGVTALVSPIVVKSEILKKELPILVIITLISFVLLFDYELSFFDALILLVLFFLIMGWTIYTGAKNKDDNLATEFEQEDAEKEDVSLKTSIMWLIIGLTVLIASSRILVWGAVELATAFNVSEIIIGLTIVAVGTSLPELASSVAAAKKGEDDIALGNVIGSNLFNTLAVVGISGSIMPFEVPHEVVTRDMSIMTVLTLSLFALGYGFSKGPGSITRPKGVLLLVIYIAYTALLIYQSIGIPAGVTE